MYKVISEMTVTKKNEKGQDEHLTIPRKGGKVFGYVSCYKKEYVTVKDNLTFQEAKQIRSEIRNSYIVRQ